MAQHPQRVLRVYSLPVELFDHLKATQRQRQHSADQRHGRPASEGDEHWVTNSDALAALVYVHRVMTNASERGGMTLDNLAAVLAVKGFQINAESGAVQVGT